jgi:hypothetical protein
MKLGTSLRFLYPTGEHAHVLFRQMLAAMPPRSFIEQPLGATDTGEQARNVLAVGEAARDPIAVRRLRKGVAARGRRVRGIALHAAIATRFLDGERRVL